MKNLLSIFVFLIFGAISGITQNAPKTPFTTKDSLLCREWKMKSFERFGLEHSPEDKQKSDNIIFMRDMKMKIVKDGVTKTGTWSTDKYKTYINMVLDGNEKLMYKLMSVDDKELIYEYQEPSLIRTVFHFEAVK